MSCRFEPSFCTSNDTIELAQNSCLPPMLQPVSAVRQAVLLLRVAGVSQAISRRIEPRARRRRRRPPREAACEVRSTACSEDQRARFAERLARQLSDRGRRRRRSAAACFDSAAAALCPRGRAPRGNGLGPCAVTNSTPLGSSIRNTRLVSLQRELCFAVHDFAQISDASAQRAHQGFRVAARAVDRIIDAQPRVGDDVPRAADAPPNARSSPAAVARAMRVLRRTRSGKLTARAVVA